MLREIEALISQRIGAAEIRLMLDTERRGKKLGKDDILEIAGIKSDARAHIAVVAAPKGADRPARKEARSANVLLVPALDAPGRQWMKRLQCPAFLDIRLLLFAMSPELPRQAAGRLVEMLRTYWEAGELPTDLDVHSYTVVVPCWKQEEEISTVQVRIQEKRFVGFRNMPLAWLGWSGAVGQKGPRWQSELLKAWQQWERAEEPAITGEVVPVSLRSVQAARVEGDRMVPLAGREMAMPVLPAGSDRVLALEGGEIPLRVRYVA